MSAAITCTAEEALKKLKEGNQKYLTAQKNEGNISAVLRKKTCEEGQTPYAIVITCSDSRVIPESIFSAGIGELFVIRVAGNVIDKHQLGSIEYAADHLGSPLVLVLGHTNCGAVGAALATEGHVDSCVGSIIDEVHKAIGGEKDPDKAVELNVKHSKAAVEKALGGTLPITVVGAVYHLDSGKVEFME